MQRVVRPGPQGCDTDALRERDCFFIAGVGDKSAIGFVDQFRRRSLSCFRLSNLKFFLIYKIVTDPDGFPSSIKPQRFLWTQDSQNGFDWKMVGIQYLNF